MKAFKSGHYQEQGYYKSFQPNGINRHWAISDMDVLKLLTLADRQIGRLDMYSEYVNIVLFIQMHIAKEATQSSRIEGTQTAYRLIEELEKLGILVEVTGSQRKRLYAFEEYLNIFSK